MTDITRIELSLTDMRALQSFAQLATPRCASPSEALDRVQSVMLQLVNDDQSGLRHYTFKRTEIDGAVANPKDMPLKAGFTAQAAKVMHEPPTELVPVTFQEKTLWQQIESYMKSTAGLSETATLGHVVGASIRHVAELAKELEVPGPQNDRSRQRYLGVVMVDTAGKQTGPGFGYTIRGLTAF